MKILKIIHGFPPFYMAGSEVYSQNLVRELAKEHEVVVFTRIENPYQKNYSLSYDKMDHGKIIRINKPSRDYTFKDKYIDLEVDQVFREILQAEKPDIIHIGHLSHLSTNIPLIAKMEFNTPIVFTVHDFWMKCFKGQCIKPDLTICNGPNTSDCFDCEKYYFKDWANEKDITDYHQHMDQVLQAIDHFLCPSNTLLEFYEKIGVPNSKLNYAPYGFDTSKITPINKTDRVNKPLRFGYMGRVIPVKGIDLLIQAMNHVKHPAELNVWGNTKSDEAWLKELISQDTVVRFHGSFKNDDIQDVLNNIDILVVPSIWLENAPLVIQEAQLARIPVVTSNKGGMLELVEDKINGYLFELGDINSLSKVLNQLAENPLQLKSLELDNPKVKSIHEDAAMTQKVYQRLTQTKSPDIQKQNSPWRITFVTNPGQCNLKCDMCDTHSPLAPKELERKKRPTLAIEDLEKTVRELAPIGLKEIIPSTMGEPLLYKDFQGIIDIAHETGVKINLTTNGTFPIHGVQKWAERLLPVISDVKISINGVTDKTNSLVMGGIQHIKQRENILSYLYERNKYYQIHGIYSSVTFQTTVMKSNFLELPDLLKWAIEIGIDRFKCHQLWVTWPELESESLRTSPELASQWNRVADELKEIAATCTLDNGKHIKLEHVEYLNIEEPMLNSDDKICPFIGKEAWVEADGSFQICCCPEDKRKDFGDFGNIKTNSLKQLWDQPAYDDFITTWGEHPNCQECNMRRKVEA